MDYEWWTKWCMGNNGMNEELCCMGNDGMSDELTNVWGNDGMNDEISDVLETMEWVVN